MRSITICLLTATALAVGACGGGDDKKSAAAATSSARESLNTLKRPRDARITVTLNGLAFRPAYIVGRPGQTLVFKNEDDLDHRIESRNGVPWDSGRLSPGETYDVLAKRQGDAMGVDFICTIHPKMYGAITWPG